jgi:two-component system chemotaxis response regulator CheB
LQDGELTRFRCRAGHAWTADGLLARQSGVFEEALWTALRSLEESAALARQIAARNRTRGGESLAGRFERQAEVIETRAAVIRAALAKPREASRSSRGRRR